MHRLLYLDKILTDMIPTKDEDLREKDVCGIR